MLAKRIESKSKIHAREIYNSLDEFIRSTKSAEFDQKLRDSALKTLVFREEFLKKARPGELSVLAEFLSQEEFAEEILTEVAWSS